MQQGCIGRTQTDDDTFCCEIEGCNYTTRTTQSLRNHNKAVHQKILIHCPFKESVGCPAVFKNNSALRTHVKAMHEPFNEPEVCPFVSDERICVGNFRTKFEFEKHLTTFHSGKRIICPLKDKKCCMTVCASPIAIVRHIKQKHGPENENREGLTTALTGCNRKFPTKAARNNHIKNDHPPKSILCPYREELGCEERLTNDDSLGNHIRRHGEPTYKCTEAGCEKGYFSLPHLIRHSEIHRPSFSCTVPRCHFAVSGALFTSVNIQRHMLNHRKLGHLNGLEPYLEPLQISVHRESSTSCPQQHHKSSEEIRENSGENAGEQKSQGDAVKTRKTSVGDQEKESGKPEIAECSEHIDE
jgi:hypothetical protein